MKVRNLLIVVFLFTGSLSKAQNNLATSQAIYVYNFLRYIKWPDNSIGDKFVITVYGNSPIYSELVNFTRTRKFGAKPIVINRTNNPDEIKGSHVVFVSSEKTNSIASIKQEIGKSPLLIIGEMEGSKDMGATIELLLLNNRLNFRIDEISAQQQQLIVSKELLKLSI